MNNSANITQFICEYVQHKYQSYPLILVTDTEFPNQYCIEWSRIHGDSNHSICLQIVKKSISTIAYTRPQQNSMLQKLLYDVNKNWTYLFSLYWAEGVIMILSLCHFLFKGSSALLYMVVSGVSNLSFQIEVSGRSILPIWTIPVSHSLYSAFTFVLP